VWQHATAAAGIKWIKSPALTSPTPANRRVLAEVVSASLDSIAHEVNTRSLNIGAELILLWGGGPVDAPEKLMAHVRAVTGLDAVHLVDGSGLSDQDRVAPVVFTTYLAKFPLTPAGKDFPMLLAANGSGTLKRLARGLPGPGVVRAKTGTLDHVVNLVGYLGRTDGTLLIAMMYSGATTASARQAEWDLFRQLGAHGIVIPPTETSPSNGGP
jgi:D-alanyl-D-alanine carboxypeptidase